MNTENSKMNEPHKFVLNLRQRLDLRSSNKHVALQNLSIYYTHGTIIRTGITCKKIPCYMLNSACRWFIVKKAKIF